MESESREPRRERVVDCERKQRCEIEVNDRLPGVIQQVEEPAGVVHKSSVVGKVPHVAHPRPSRRVAPFGHLRMRRKHPESLRQTHEISYFDLKTPLLNRIWKRIISNLQRSRTSIPVHQGYDDDERNPRAHFPPCY